jgi:membrane protein
VALRDLRTPQHWETTFPGRCLGSFLAMQGIDRAMALSAQAFTALIPLLLVLSALAPASRSDAVSDAVTGKFGISGEAAQAVEQLFARPADGAIGGLSFALLVFSGVSFTRRMQRMYLQAWRLESIPGVRSSLNAAAALTVLVLEIGLLSLARTLVDGLPFGWGLGAPLSILASLVLWTSVPWLLLDRRIPWRRLLPVGVLTAVATSLYGVATTIYMPRAMEANSERFGLFGVTLSLVGWLLCIAIIMVVATVLATEFDRAQDHWARRLRARLRIGLAGRPADVDNPTDRPAVLS